MMFEFEVVKTKLSLILETIDIISKTTNYRTKQQYYEIEITQFGGYQETHCKGFETNC